MIVFQRDTFKRLPRYVRVGDLHCFSWLDWSVAWIKCSLETYTFEIARNAINSYVLAEKQITTVH